MIIANKIKLNVLNYNYNKTISCITFQKNFRRNKIKLLIHRSSTIIITKIFKCLYCRNVTWSVLPNDDIEMHNKIDETECPAHVTLHTSSNERSMAVINSN